MKVIREVDANSFEFWAGARDTVKYLTDDEINTIFDLIEYDDLLGTETPTETDINDLFWFDDDYIAELLGYSSFDEIRKERKDR